MKITLISALLGILLAGSICSADVLTIDASAPVSPPVVGTFNLGASTAPDGHTLTVNTRNLVLDSQPWLPIAGEFHFSRTPDAEWRDELLKMKAGGISIVSTYIFWIHHEEVQGKWDWTGQRDLHKFLQLCKDVGLDVILRIGPWCHGEVRNGGFPDWLQKMGDNNVLKLRTDDPLYLGYVTKLYEQIGQQARGLLWKDGGPVIGIQLENEFSGPAQHLLTLKKMAQDAGMDVPLYTHTGAGGGNNSTGAEILPMSGGYAENFWDRSITAAAGGGGGVFNFSGGRGRGNYAAATGDLLNAGRGAAAATPAPTAAAYPNFSCETGGGMMSSYHRRIFTSPGDIESEILVKMGSGTNLLGIYMYHGGENPDGQLSYLTETQATNSYNDLPVKNYDFQAPIGAFGEEREHYHWLRLLGLFLEDFGSGLAGMTPRTPAPTAPGGAPALNWSVRSDGSSGYIFVSNYQQLAPRPAREGVQFQIKLADGKTAMVPSAPTTIPADSRFFWPFNLKLGAATLLYSTTQPICGVDDQGTHYTVFMQTGNVPAEFAFDAATVTLDATTGQTTTENGAITVRQVPPGPGAGIKFHTADGKKQAIVVLDQPTALTLWRGAWQGAERLFLTSATLLLDGSAVRLQSNNPADLTVAMLPAPATITEDKKSVPGKDDGVFHQYTAAVSASAPLVAQIESVQPAGPAREIPIASVLPSRRQGMAMQPEDADFAAAAVWRVKLPAGIDPASDVRLRLRYTGDVARVYLDDKLISDDFYHTRPLDLDLRRDGPQVRKDGLVIKILPLRQDAPIYLTDASKLNFDNPQHAALALDGVDLLLTREARLEAGP